MILQFFSKEALRQHILRGQCSATNQCKKLAGVLSISSVLNTLLSLYHGAVPPPNSGSMFHKKNQDSGSFAFTANPEFPFWKLFVIQSTGVGLLLSTQ